MNRAFLSLTLLIAATATTAAAPPLPLDLVPADATAAVAAPNLKKLQEKGDKLVADSGANLPRFSDAFNQMFGWLGVKVGLDPEQSVAVLLARRDQQKEGQINLDELVRLIVVVIPFKDRDQIAGNFGFKAGEFKPDKVTA